MSLFTGITLQEFILNERSGMPDQFINTILTIVIYIYWKGKKYTKKLKMFFSEF